MQIGADRRAVHARVATREERERLWPTAVATYAGHRGYQQRTDRSIPLVILEPRRWLGIHFAPLIGRGG